VQLEDAMNGVPGVVAFVEMADCAQEPELVLLVLPEKYNKGKDVQMIIA